MTDRLNKRIKNLPENIWALINNVDLLKGQWVGGAQLNPHALGRLKRSVLVTSTGASTRIEGAKLSDEDVEKLIRGLSMQKFANRDKQEVKGYYELLENVFNSWKHIPFSESTIKHFHTELLKYVEKDDLHRGQYKKKENKVAMVNGAGQSIEVLFDTTPAYLTQKEVQELVDWVNVELGIQKIHPLIVIGNFLVEFLKIHPFEDGNGRLSRILANLLLLQAGYGYVPYVSHEKLVEGNKSEYYVALRRSQKTFKSDKETVLPWFEFLFQILLEQARKAIELLSKENIERILSLKQLAVWQYIEKTNEVTPLEISKSVSIARPTVSQALNVLLRLKKIERIGQGRTTRYRKI